MRVPRPKCSLAPLALLVAVVACSDSPTAPASADAAFAQAPQAQEKSSLVQNSDLDGMSDRELLVAVLGKLNALETRMENETQAVYARIDSVLNSVAVTPVLAQAGSPNESDSEDAYANGPPDDPGIGKGGIPVLLDAISQQLAAHDDHLRFVRLGLRAHHSHLAAMKAEHEAEVICGTVAGEISGGFDFDFSGGASGKATAGVDAAGSGGGFKIELDGGIGFPLEIHGKAEIGRQWCIVLDPSAIPGTIPVELDDSDLETGQPAIAAATSTQTSTTEQALRTAAMNLGVDGAMALDNAAAKVGAFDISLSGFDIRQFSGALPTPTLDGATVMDVGQLWANGRAFRAKARQGICGQAIHLSGLVKTALEKGCQFLANDSADLIDFDGGFLNGFFN